MFVFFPFRIILSFLESVSSPLTLQDQTGSNSQECPSGLPQLPLKSDGAGSTRADRVRISIRRSLTYSRPCLLQDMREDASAMAKAKVFLRNPSSFNTV